MIFPARGKTPSLPWPRWPNPPALELPAALTFPRVMTTCAQSLTLFQENRPSLMITNFDRNRALGTRCMRILPLWHSHLIILNILCIKLWLVCVDLSPILASHDNFTKCMQFQVLLWFKCTSLNRENLRTMLSIGG